MSDRTYNLKLLAETWRARARAVELKLSARYPEGAKAIVHVYEQCADDLERMIELIDKDDKK